MSAIAAVEDKGKDERKSRRKLRTSINTQIFTTQVLVNEGGGVWITSILRLDKNPGFEETRGVILERLTAMPRFRSVVNSKGIWEEIEISEMDPSYHFKEVLTDHSVSLDELHEYVQNMYVNWKPDRGKPLWLLEFVPALENGETCVLMRVNHAIGDGVSQVQVLLNILDPDTDHEKVKPKGKRKTDMKSFGPINRFLIGTSGFFEGFYLPFVSPDPPNALSRPKGVKPSTVRKFAFSGKIDLEQVKQVKEKLEGATVNDVLIWNLGLTLREFFDKVANDKDIVEGRKKVRAQFPVSLRGREEPAFRDGDPHNVVSYGVVTFQMKMKTGEGIVDLFWRIKRQNNVTKLSPAPVVALSTVKALASIISVKRVTEIAGEASSLATLQLSSVMGPPSKVKIAGATVNEMDFMLESDAPCYCGLLSYDGKISCSISVDSSVEADPSDVLKFWVPSFQNIREEVLKREGIIKAKRQRFDWL